MDATTINNLIPMLVGGIFLLAAGAFIQYLYMINAIKTRGVPGEAKVTRKFTRGGKRRVYYWEVEFKDRTGRTIETYFSVPSHVWHDMKEGTSIPIIYIPDKPKKCHHPQHIDAMWNAYSLQAAFFMIGIICFIAYHVYTQIDPEQAWLKSVMPETESEE